MYSTQLLCALGSLQVSIHLSPLIHLLLVVRLINKYVYEYLRTLKYLLHQHPCSRQSQSPSIPSNPALQSLQFAPLLEPTPRPAAPFSVPFSIHFRPLEVEDDVYKACESHSVHKAILYSHSHSDSYWPLSFSSSLRSPPTPLLQKRK